LLALVIWELLPWGNVPIKFLAAAPLAVYLVAIILQTLALIPAGGVGRSLLAMPLLGASHLFYGLGFWRGLFTKLKTGGERPTVSVTLENIKF
jgi:hypothetical protein